MAQAVANIEVEKQKVERALVEIQKDKEKALEEVLIIKKQFESDRERYRRSLANIVMEGDKVTKTANENVNKAKERASMLIKNAEVHIEDLKHETTALKAKKDSVYNEIKEAEYKLASSEKKLKTLKDMLN